MTIVSLLYNRVRHNFALFSFWREAWQVLLRAWLPVWQWSLARSTSTPSRRLGLPLSPLPDARPTSPCWWQRWQCRGRWRWHRRHSMPSPSSISPTSTSLSSLSLLVSLSRRLSVYSLVSSSFFGHYIMWTYPRRILLPISVIRDELLNCDKIIVSKLFKTVTILSVVLSQLYYKRESIWEPSANSVL